MKNREIHCLNNIGKAGLDMMRPGYTLTDDPDKAHAILVRAADMHETEFSPVLRAIARAGAGVNNIPLEKCAEKGIVVFNTPGANANAVKELVVAGLMLASRDIIGGVEWVKEHAGEPDIAKAAEKAKKAFGGNEISGKKLGVIGLGAIGVLVANTALSLGMEVYGYDPYISVGAAWSLRRGVHHSEKAEELYEKCDYITLHVPALPSTNRMINADTISKMKDGVRILNFARDLLVDEEELKKALESGKVSRYVTDFATPAAVTMKNTVITPHLGASTEESEEKCAIMAVQEVTDYLDNGIITHSVNYPDCDPGACRSESRLLCLHRNIPNMLGQLTAIMGEENINIDNLVNKSREKYACTVIDIESRVTDEALSRIQGIDGMLRVRIVR